LYKEYKEKAQFFMVYIREAHPVRKAGDKSRHGPSITQHKTTGERAIAATECIQKLKISLPTLIDEMSKGFQAKYGGFQAGTNIIDIDGKIAFSSRGPWGAKPKEARKVLDKLLANGGRLPAKDVKPVKETKEPAKPAGKPAKKPEKGKEKS